MPRSGLFGRSAVRIRRWIKDHIVGSDKQASYAGPAAAGESIADGLKELERASLAEFRERLPPKADEVFTADGRVAPEFAKKTVNRATKWTVENVVHGVGALLTSFLVWLFGLKHGRPAETGGVAATPDLARFLERHQVNPKTADGMFEFLLPLVVFAVAFAALRIVGFWSWVTGRRGSRLPADHEPRP